MKTTQKSALILCALFLPHAAQGAPIVKTLIVRDFRIGDSLWMQTDEAKSGTAIRTDILKPAKALSDPKDQKQVDARKMVVTGFPGKTYHMGFYVFDEEQHPERFFPIGLKSIYFLSGYDTNPNVHLLRGADIMFTGYPPVDFLNSPWAKVSDGITRTSTMVDIPLASGMNYVAIHLDPFKKIQEDKRTLSNGPEGDSPWTDLDDNNDAIYAIELVAPKKLTIKLP